ncbi:hypothetical protein CBL_13840 [Carabus blaptoides fortunei]
MRGCFRKELKKVDNSQRSGAGTDDTYEPTLSYFELLLFTRDQEVPVSSIETAEFTDSENSECQTKNEEILETQDELHEETVSRPEMNFQKPMTPKKRNMPTLLSDETPSRKKNSFKLHQEAQRQQQNQFYKACTQVLQQKDTDEFEAIGINIAAKLKKMDSVQQLLAEGLINKILQRANSIDRCNGQQLVRRSITATSIEFIQFNTCYRE